MTEPPAPPGPDNQLARQQQSQDDGVFLPLNQVRGIARMWSQFRPIIGWGAKIVRQNIPKELDEFMNMVNAGESPGQIQGQLQQGIPPGQWMPPQGDMEVPENAIGERVLARDEANLAWNLVRVQGYSYRAARDLLASKFGVNVSHATVKNYCDEIDAEMGADREMRHMAIYKNLFFFTATGVAFFLLGHFLRF